MLNFDEVKGIFEEKKKNLHLIIKSMRNNRICVLITSKMAINGYCIIIVRGSRFHYTCYRKILYVTGYTSCAMTSAFHRSDDIKTRDFNNDRSNVICNETLYFKLQFLF